MQNAKIKMQNDNVKLKNLKYLGVDWGEKRIGLALGDSETGTAIPFKVVGSIDEVVRVVKEENIDMIALGKPVRMSDVRIKMSNEFLEFVSILKKKLDVSIEMVDERLTSKGADALIGDKKTKAPRDAVAAMLILQTYLDRKDKI